MIRASLLLVVLSLWLNHCDSLTNNSLFYPFGSDEGDSVVTLGDDDCDGPFLLPVSVFNHHSIFVSPVTV